MIHTDRVAELLDLETSRVTELADLIGQLGEPVGHLLVCNKEESCEVGVLAACAPPLGLLNPMRVFTLAMVGLCCPVAPSAKQSIAL